ncbi:FCD domain-containing protein [Rhodobacteraceae bacterium M385]|nr:FCD domain-containing protein [Rhodobacteraceae bacterium M385]
MPIFTEPAQPGAAKQRDKLHMTVSGAIESQILSGALKVGDKLPSESAIAKEFAVSTRSVREAIGVLETKGLVARRHGERTTVVREDVDEFLGTLAVTVRQKFSTDPEYLIQLMEVRRMIETEVLGILTARSDPISEQVEAELEAMEAARDSGDFQAFVDADARFHLALVYSAGNAILSVIYDNLAGLINEVIQVTSRVPTKSLEAAYSEHAEIFSFIKNRDEVRAKSLMRTQIDNSATYLKTALERAENSKDDT